MLLIIEVILRDDRMASRLCMCAGDHPETDVKDRLIRNSVSVYCANRVVCADKRAVRADPI